MTPEEQLDALLDLMYGSNITDEQYEALRLAVEWLKAEYFD